MAARTKVYPISLGPGWALIPYKGELVPVRKGRGYKGYVATGDGWVEVGDIHRIDEKVLARFSWEALHKLVDELREETKEKLGPLGFLSIGVSEVKPIREEVEGTPARGANRILSFALSALFFSLLGFAVGYLFLKSPVGGALLALAGVGLAYLTNPKAEVKNGRLYLGGKPVEGNVWIVFSIAENTAKGNMGDLLNAKKDFYVVSDTYKHIPEYAVLHYLREGGKVYLIYPKIATRAVLRYLRHLGLL